MKIFILDPRADPTTFPNPELALTDPNGLLAAGGDLSPARIVAAYRQGIFPWYNPGEPILWWSPDPRAVLYPDHLKISRSLRKTLNKKLFHVTLDTAFSQVMQQCASPREGQQGTWITPEILAAYSHLHTMGVAHSVECWQGEQLVGGLYGLALGKVFFGESMFSKVTDASKVALVYLVAQLKIWGYELIDCQVATAHLLSLGAELIPRAPFLSELLRLCASGGQPQRWHFDPDLDPIGLNSPLRKPSTP